MGCRHNVLGLEVCIQICVEGPIASVVGKMVTGGPTSLTLALLANVRCNISVLPQNGSGLSPEKVDSVRG